MMRYTDLKFKILLGSKQGGGLAILKYIKVHPGVKLAKNLHFDILRYTEN